MNKIKILLFLLLFSTLINKNTLFAQNMQIDTILNINSYKDYIRKSDYLIKLIADGRFPEILRIYEAKGNFFKMNSDIKHKLEDFHELIKSKDLKMILTKSNINLPPS